MPFNKSIGMFDHIDIEESLYEGVVEPSTKILTRTDSNRDGIISKTIGIYSLSKINPYMGLAVKCKTRYVEHLSSESPPTCMIHDKVH